MRDLIIKALIHLKRKVILLANTPTCPECGDLTPDVNQVQLVDYVNTIPAKWKCRVCKHKFEFEPEYPDDNEE